MLRLKMVWIGDEMMEVLEYSLEYSVIETDQIKNVTAVIVAAGSSNRMGGVNKQFLLLKGIPVVCRTLIAFQKCSVISKIIVVCKPEDANEIQNLSIEYHIDKLSDITDGGASRAQSVLNGVSRVDSNCSLVLIHDGARPLVSNEVIERVVKAAKKHGAVTCVVPLKDTVKVINEDGFVVNTPNRSSMVAVQTPQGFKIDVYKKAVEIAGKDIDKFSDECSLVESAGNSVYTVEGDYRNIKITTDEDISIATTFLKENE